MKKIDSKLLNTTSRLAKDSKRQRMNHNFHSTPDDTLQRLLNAIEPYSYVQPHKHEAPDKREVFFALKGRMLVVEFDDIGNITDQILLDPAGGNFGAEIAPRTWHTIISLEEGSVAYEFKDGPYSPVDDKNFASWAPVEGSAETLNYIHGILAKTGYDIQKTPK